MAEIDSKQPGPAPAPPTSQQPAAQVDIEQLAERVYQLMRAELRLEHARGERATRRKTR